MCCSILVVHFGCDQKHVKEVLKRCKPGLEWQLNMNVTGTCPGWKMSEDWLMSRCRFCEEYFQAKQACKPRARAASCTAIVVPEAERGEIRNSDCKEEPITRREKDSVKQAALPILAKKIVEAIRMKQSLLPVEARLFIVPGEHRTISLDSGSML